MKRWLAAHLHWYTPTRTHHALGGLLVSAVTAPSPRATGHDYTQGDH
ncbi:MAG: hypothetical protein R3B48_29675 [Kofleriaceae bacterium]